MMSRCGASCGHGDHQRAICRQAILSGIELAGKQLVEETIAAPRRGETTAIAGENWQPGRAVREDDDRLLLACRQVVIGSEHHFRLDQKTAGAPDPVHPEERGMGRLPQARILGRRSIAETQDRLPRAEPAFEFDDVCDG